MGTQEQADLDRQAYAVYGYRTFGIFCKHLELTPDGIKYRGRNYPWSDIRKIETFDEPTFEESLLHGFLKVRYFHWGRGAAWMLGYDGAWIHLQDGRKILVYSHILRKGERAPAGWSSVPLTDAFNALIGTIQRRLDAEQVWGVNSPKAES